MLATGSKSYTGAVSYFCSGITHGLPDRRTDRVPINTLLSFSRLRSRCVLQPQGMGSSGRIIFYNSLPSRSCSISSGQKNVLDKRQFNLFHQIRLERMPNAHRRAASGTRVASLVIQIDDVDIGAF